MKNGKSALLLIGFQNDYFSPEGVLHSVLENQETVLTVLANTLKTIEASESNDVVIVETPIIFTRNYEELVEPVGILKMIRDLKAFQSGSPGSETIAELTQFSDRIERMPGKRGLNAFAKTNLDDFLRERDVTEVALAGVVTSLCIDSTGRAAHERDYRVTVLADCTCGRTKYEQDFYCSEVFPLYGNVQDSSAWLNSMN